jgi:hypothetical protein
MRLAPFPWVKSSEWRRKRENGQIQSRQSIRLANNDRDYNNIWHKQGTHNCATRTRDAHSRCRVKCCQCAALTLQVQSRVCKAPRPTAAGSNGRQSLQQQAALVPLAPLLIFRQSGRRFRHFLLVRPQVGLGVALAVGNTRVVV